MLERIFDSYPDEEFLTADGFDDAVIGLDEVSLRIIYSKHKMIVNLMEQGMSDVEAEEFFDFNISGAYMGEKTPIYMEEY